MKSLKTFTLTIGILSAAAGSAQAAAIDHPPANWQCQIAQLEGKVQKLATEVQVLQIQTMTSARQSVDTKPDTSLPLGAQFGIATGG